MSLLIFSFILLCGLQVKALNLEYLDPTILQTRASPEVQRQTASDIVSKYTNYPIEITVNPILFHDKKDVFILRSENDRLYITASTGVAAVWGFNYFLKKYCKSQIEWQTSRVEIPERLPEIDEVIIANDRFRYYQNVRTASYSFVWWSVSDWMNHVEWMALNGINMVLAPVAQEAVWAEVYRRIGMTEEEIDDHFTGPPFLSWLRTGNLYGWNGPLFKSWHDHQKNIQNKVVTKLYQLGIVPVLPAFNGHVPKAFSRIYPNATYNTVEASKSIDSEYCCSLFLHPSNSQFKKIGKMFLNEVTTRTGLSHVYIVDPFIEVSIKPWSEDFVQETARAIYETLTEIDNAAVWMVQNSIFIHNKDLWSESMVEAFLTSIPNGRFLVLDLQSEQKPLYNTYPMYYGQPFIWCMLHNFGGTLGMYGNMNVINTEVYKVRQMVNSTMVGIGLTPEGINQNYVIYDLMLETAWRAGPVEDLQEWVADYAERRYGCNNTASAWKYLLRSVYNFTREDKEIKGKYVITSRPSFNIRPWAWYSSRDLFKAFKKLVTISNNKCHSPGYFHDVVDVTRQALQYRAEQIYLRFSKDMYSPLIFNSTINQFLDIMNDIEVILGTNNDFSASDWFRKAREIGDSFTELYIYELGARKQITVWGPNDEYADTACRQWAELFHYYYTPRWRSFLSMALNEIVRNGNFEEDVYQRVVKTVEIAFLSSNINDIRRQDTLQSALELYGKWAYVAGLDDLPFN